MLFVMTLQKQATEECFCNKFDNVSHEPLTFSNSKTQSASSQKHSGLVWDFKLDFYKCIDEKIKFNKIIEIMKSLLMTLSWNNNTLILF